MEGKREMTAIEYLKEKRRMSKKCDIGCIKCMIGDDNNGMTVSCDTLENEHPEKAVEIVQKWSEEHPQKTFLTDFLEKYPNAMLNKGGFPSVCPYRLGYISEIKCPAHSIFDDRCKECWDRPLEE